MRTNQMQWLKKLLKASDIAFEEKWNGINVPFINAEHSAVYEISVIVIKNSNCLEIGFAGLTKEEFEDDDVYRFASAIEVLERIVYCYNHNTHIFKR